MSDLVNTIKQALNKDGWSFDGMSLQHPDLDWRLDLDGVFDRHYSTIVRFSLVEYLQIRGLIKAKMRECVTKKFKELGE